MSNIDKWARESQEKVEEKPKAKNSPLMNDEIMCVTIGEEGAQGFSSKTGYYANCRGCGQATLIDYPIEEFEADMHYCGRSERCIP